MSIDYKTELELSHLKDVALERDAKNEDEYCIVHDFFGALNQLYFFFEKKPEFLLKKMKELYEIIKKNQLPFSESIIQSGILDFCLDRYCRSHQDSDCGFYGLLIINYFAHLDGQYCEYIISKNFLDISEISIRRAFPKFYRVEVDTLNCLISHELISHYFCDYKIDIITQNVRKINDLDTLYIVYDFISSFLQLPKIIEKSVLDILNLYIIIKEKNDYNSDYSTLYTKKWPEILLKLILTDYFNTDLFFQGALFIFYEQNYCNPDYMKTLGVFYTNFISKFPDQRMLLTFNFYDYFDQLKNSDDDNLKQFAYATLSDYLYIFFIQQKVDVDKGISSEFNFDLFIHQIPDDFIQNVLLSQIYIDVFDGRWNTKRCALCFLANFTYIRPDIILKNMSVVDYINLFDDFIQSNFLKYILLSIESIYNSISSFQNFHEILHEVVETDTYKDLCELAESTDCDEELSLEIKRIMNYFADQ